MSRITVREYLDFDKAIDKAKKGEPLNDYDKHLLDRIKDFVENKLHSPD